MPGQEWSRGFAEDKERRLVRKHLPYSQGLTMIIVISWWFVMIMLMMSLCPNSWWWCCLRSSVSACDNGDVALTSPEALFCNQNYTFTDRGRLQAKALLVPTTTSALKTSCHLLYTQHRLRSSLIILERGQKKTGLFGKNSQVADPLPPSPQFGNFHIFYLFLRYLFAIL